MVAAVTVTLLLLLRSWGAGSLCDVCRAAPSIGRTGPSCGAVSNVLLLGLAQGSCQCELRALEKVDLFACFINFISVVR